MRRRPRRFFSPPKARDAGALLPHNAHPLTHPNPSPNPMEGALEGLGTAVLLAGGGAAIGYATGKPDALLPQAKTIGATGGALLGAGIAIIGGVAVAAVSERHRSAGLWTSSIGGSLVTLIAIAGALHRSASNTNPPPQTPKG